MKHFSLSDLIQYEALQALCGDMLGKGMRRTVFRNRFCDETVIKAANNPDGVSVNTEGMQTWKDMYGDARRWFAECLYLSNYGSILVQEFVPELPKGKYKIPAFFADVKAENFGLRTGANGSQVVCRDYGYHHLREKGQTKKLVVLEAK